jgi:hypothetical protein
LVLKTPIDHAPDVAEIDVSIDGSRRRWFVNLPDGLAVQLRKTRIASLEPDNGDNERSPSPIAP